MNRQSHTHVLRSAALFLAFTMLSGLPALQPAFAGDQHYTSRSVQSPPTLPYLPNFGGQFIRGHEYPMAGTTKCWVLRYGFSGTGPQVIASMQQALPSQGWTIDPNQSKSEQFTAERRKDHLTLSVRTQPGRTTGSVVATVRYIENKPQS